MMLIGLQVAEQQARLLGTWSPCDVSLPPRYRDYLIVKRNYELHRPENVVSAAKVNQSHSHRIGCCVLMNEYAKNLTIFNQSTLSAAGKGTL